MLISLRFYNVIPVIPTNSECSFKFQKMPMPKITFKDYIEGIKAKYEEEKTKKYSGYLAKPSPASLKNLCDILKKENTSKKDQEIISLFYNKEGFDVDKFKPIGNFFSGKTQSPSHDILDMMALLVNFEPRPLGKFLEVNNQCSKEYTGQESMTLHSPSEKELIKVNTPLSLASIPNNSLPQNAGTKFTLSNKKAIIALLLFCAFISLLTYNLLTSHKECLEWQNNHYVEVDCTTEIKGIANFETKIPYDESLLKIKKIIPTDSTTYFKNGKAILWYCKNENGSIELFNTPGYHPVTNKTLKPITHYMIKKYLENKSN